jgi:hypothetical protein
MARLTQAGMNALGGFQSPFFDCAEIALAANSITPP